MHYFFLLCTISFKNSLCDFNGDFLCLVFAFVDLGVSYNLGSRASLSFGILSRFYLENILSRKYFTFID